MKRTWQVLAMGSLLLALVASTGFAQRQRATQGQGALARVRTRDAHTQRVGRGQGGKINPQAGGWWNRVNPTDPPQQAFAQEVAALHNQIREAQLALRQLETAQADPQIIAAKQAEIAALRARLHGVQFNNQALRQSITGQSATGTSRGQGVGFQQGKGTRQRQGPGFEMCPNYLEFGMCPDCLDGVCPDCPVCE